MTASSPLRDPKAIGLLLCASLVVMTNATISPALPGLAAKFAGQPNAELFVRLLVPAPSLAALFISPLAGGLSDRIGRGPMLILASLLFLGAGTAGAVIETINGLLLSRLLLGCALAIIIAVQTALIGDFFTGPTRDRFVGYQVSVRNLGGLVYVLLSGALATQAAEWVFAVYALTAVYLPFIFAAAKAAPKRIIKTAPQKDDPQTNAWATQVAGLCGLLLGITMVFFIMPTQLPFLLQSKSHGAPMTISIAMASVMISGGIAAAQYGRLSAAFSAPILFAAGFACMTLGLITLALGSMITIGLGCLIIGAAYALLVSTASSLILNVAPKSRRGLASGLSNSAVFLGAVLSPLITTPLIQTVGFSATYVAAAGLTVTAALGAGIVAHFPRAQRAAQ